MSREPTSDANRYNEAAARWGQSPEPPTPPAAAPAKRKKYRIRVEPAKKPAPKRDIYGTRWKDLTPDEMAEFRLHPKEKR